MVDLHGLIKLEAIRVTKAHLSDAHQGLKDGKIQPNHGNGIDHIFKVITGAGKHSFKGAVLKPTIH